MLAEHSLHEQQIEPALEFAADLAQLGGLGEAGASVQGDGGFVAGLDAGDHHVLAGFGCVIDEGGKQGAADALAVVIGVNIDRVFHGLGEAFEGAIFAVGGKAGDVGAGVGDEDGETAGGAVMKPGGSGFERGRGDGPEGGGVQDGVVGDAQDGGKIVWGGGADDQAQAVAF